MNNFGFASAFACLSILIAGCSFSKESTGNKHANNLSVSNEKAPSLLQRQLLLDVERNDIEAMSMTVGNFAPEDFDFSDLAKTPAGVAINLNNSQAFSVLQKLGLSPFQLGQKDIEFQQKSTNLRIKEVYKKIGHKNGEKIDVLLNETESLLSGVLQNEVAQIYSLLISGKNEDALARYRSTKISCEVLSNHLLLAGQGQVAEAIHFESIGKFLDILPCKISVADIRKMYELEVIRQFQISFTEPEILTYIATHGSLNNKMLNISNSGVWVSVRFLLRLAYNRIDIYVRDGKTICDESNPATQSSQFCQDDWRNGEFMDAIGFRYSPEDFEVIDARLGAPKRSFNSFPIGVWKRDTFSGKVLRYMLYGDFNMEQVDF